MHRSKTIAKTANTQTKRKSLCKKQNCEHILLAIHPIHVPPIEMISLAIYQVRCNQNKYTV